MKLLKKLVRGKKGSEHQWLVSWQEIKNQRLIDHRKFFIQEIDADNFIKSKNELQTKR